MSAAAHKLKSTLFTKNFLFGFGVAVLFYALLLLGSFVLNQGSLKTLSDKLASEAVKILRQPTNVAATSPKSEQPSDNTQSIDAPDTPLEEHTENEQTPSEVAGTLPTKPISGLYELNSKGVLLPIIRQSDNFTPFQAYSAPFEKKEGFSQIALIIDDFGLSGEQSSLVKNLPAYTSFIVSPYSSKAKDVSISLLKRGHEIWMKAPFETTNFPEHDPGPKGILKRSSLNTNQENLKWVMGQSEVYAGIAGYTDTVFSGANPTINTLSRDIINRGLGFFEINVGALPQIRDIAEKLNAPYTKNDIILHDQKWNGQFEEALDLLENIALSRGTAIGVFRAHPEIVELINQWSKDLGKRDIQIAPLSAIIKQRNPQFAATLQPNTSRKDEHNQSSSHEKTHTDDKHSNEHH